MGVNDVVDPTQNGKNVPNWIGYESGFLDAESVSAYAKNHRYGLMTATASQIATRAQP